MNLISLRAISLLATVSSSVLITIPAMGQTTTVPITAGSFSVTTVNNDTTLNPGAVILTPIGTVNVSAFQVQNFQNFNTGLNLATNTPGTRADQTGDNLQVQGLSSGTLSTTGVSFSNAPSVVDGTIRSITYNVPVSSVTSVNVTGGNIQLPTAIANPANSTYVPIAGGNFNVTAFSNGSVVNNGITILTTAGTVRLSSFSYTRAFNETTGYEPFTGGRFPIVGDRVAAEGFSTGTAPLAGGKVATLNATPTNLRGVLTGVNITPTGAIPGNQTSENYIGNFTSGSFLVPNSSISSPISTSGLILSNFPINRANLSRRRYIFPPAIRQLQFTSQQNLPPAVSFSRIHPGLRSR